MLTVELIRVIIPLPVVKEIFLATEFRLLEEDLVKDLLEFLASHV
tara:strand:+ start:758 stop:892 length:135 start_codon:yes stop_codon:yes gene_type:complete